MEADCVLTNLKSESIEESLFTIFASSHERAVSDGTTKTLFLNIERLTVPRNLSPIYCIHFERGVSKT